jgi:hypothetical protein
MSLPAQVCPYLPKYVSKLVQKKGFLNIRSNDDQVFFNIRQMLPKFFKTFNLIMYLFSKNLRKSKINIFSVELAQVL